MSESKQEESFWVVPMTLRDLGLVGAVGAGAGLLTWVIYWLITTYGGPMLFCHGDTPGLCVAAPGLVEAISLIVGAIAGLFALVRLRVFRPLLVVLAVTVMFGGIERLLSVLPWYGALLASILLFALAYIAHTWLSRVRLLVLALALVIALAVVVRLVLFS